MSKYTRLVSENGRTVRIELLTAPTTMTAELARDIGSELIAQATYAESHLPAIHERHINLQKSCALCVYEAHGQLDRLEGEEE